jgi:hypothetical protein
MSYIKACFDIQRVHVDGSSLHYEVFYREGNTFKKVTDREFQSMPEARDFINTLLEE